MAGAHTREPCWKKFVHMWAETSRMLLLLWVVMGMEMGGARSVSVTVGTYNLWNVMFNWDVRKHHIAEMIKASNIDFIGLQEVRADEVSTDHGRQRRTQVDELQELLLPDYKWSSFQGGHTVANPKDKKMVNEWQIEGLALLSKYPILRSEMQELTHHSRTDRVKRKVLHATLMVQGVEVFVSVVHLSYDKWQQCNNVAEIMAYIRDKKPKYSLILGDFNTYVYYEGPLEGFHLGYFSTQNKCPKYAKSKNPTVESELTAYDDAWKVANYGLDGFTFSNMPSPGFVSRPDRILVSNRYFRVVGTKLRGWGEEYAVNYKRQVILARRAAVIEAARRTYYGEVGGDCGYDCGPHGSCRCGVCIAGGNKNFCSLPNCRECSVGSYRRYLLARAIFAFFCLQLLLALVQIVLAMIRGSTLGHQGSSMTRTCPLLPLAPSWRHLRHLHFASCLRTVTSSCRNLALVNLTVSLLGLLVLSMLSRTWFLEALHLIEDVLPEELNPSDHLLVSSELILL
ncbi:uncharacterized protein [Diadema antillarum]|uniref:uncharacterized protein n=1 Tax=Diadema antillarum TaxID=105358 RepID=UPI003A8C4C15